MSAKPQHWRIATSQREQLSKKLDRVMVNGEHLTWAHLHLQAGCLVPFHVHDNEQASYVLAGRLRFELGEESHEVVVGAGEVLLIPGGLRHAAEALVDTWAIDVFSPPRRDWIEGRDDYLRGARS
jgi:quercetin dioxygenase-like cupin family protein